MRQALISLSFLLTTVTLMPAQNKPFKAAIIKMEMSECSLPHRFISSMSGTLIIDTVPCAEYTIISDKVVYVVIGRHAEQSLSLGADMFFREENKELVVFSDDEKSRVRFPIKQMVLRSDWEHDKANREEAAREATKQFVQHSLVCESGNSPAGAVTASIK